MLSRGMKWGHEESSYSHKRGDFSPNYKSFAGSPSSSIWTKNQLLLPFLLDLDKLQLKKYRRLHKTDWTEAALLGLTCFRKENGWNDYYQPFLHLNITKKTLLSSGVTWWWWWRWSGGGGVGVDNDDVDYVDGDGDDDDDGGGDDGDDDGDDGAGSLRRWAIQQKAVCSV